MGRDDPRQLCLFTAAPWLLNTSYVDLSFLFAPNEGAAFNTHLQQPALGTLEGREGIPYHLNLHVQDVGHSCILGSIGAGKSFLVNFLTAGYQAYAPYTVIFDLGGSYRALTSEYGGSYLHVGRESGFTINPFVLPPTAENLEFLFSFVRVLLERGNDSLTPDERKDLHRAITASTHWTRTSAPYRLSRRPARLYKGRLPYRR